MSDAVFDFGQKAREQSADDLKSLIARIREIERTAMENASVVGEMPRVLMNSIYALERFMGKGVPGSAPEVKHAYDALADAARDAVAAVSRLSAAHGYMDRYLNKELSEEERKTVLGGQPK